MRRKFSDYSLKDQTEILKYEKQLKKFKPPLFVEQLFDNLIDYALPAKIIVKIVNQDAEILKNINMEAENLIDNGYSDYQNLLLVQAANYEDIVLILVYRWTKMSYYKKVKFENSMDYAKNTLYIYAPIAHRLGLYNIKTQLEELSLYYIDHPTFLQIVQGLKHKKSARDLHVSQMIAKIETLVNNVNQSAKIFGRSKSIFSIYKKMSDKNKNLEDLFDLHALRIICDDVVECYTVLGLIHSEFEPVEGRFKDYIAFKKANLYQSLHTAIYNEENVLFEIQIRTQEMDDIAEKGIAAHWLYKQKGDNSKKDLLNLQMDEDKNMSMDLDKLIFTFSPNKKIIWLPIGASVIDFAYAIHSNVAQQMNGAKINDKIASYNDKLKSGDIVNIMTKKNFSAPTLQWLDYAITSKATKRIKLYLKQKNYDDRHIQIKMGEELFITFLKKNEIVFDINDNLQQQKIIRNFSCPRVADFYLRICDKQISTPMLREFFEEKTEEIKLVNIKSVAKHEAIIIDGATDVSKKIANCCLPVCGDEIVGVIINGISIKIHRKTCRNLSKNNVNYIDVNWNQEYSEKIQYKSQLKVITTTDVLTNIVDILAKLKCPIAKISSKQSNDNYIVNVVLAVNDLDMLEKVKSRIKQNASVISVKRSYN